MYLHVLVKLSYSEVEETCKVSKKNLECIYKILSEDVGIY